MIDDRPCEKCIWRGPDGCTNWDCDPFTRSEARKRLKTGKWSVQEIYKHEMSYGTTAYEPVYKCSACGSLMESYLRYDKPIMPEDADFPQYCPNCGAKMTGVADETA